MVSLCTNFPTHFWSAILVTKWLGFVPYLVWHDRFTMKWDDLHNICLFCKAWDCRQRTIQANYHQGTYNVQIIQSILKSLVANLLSIFKMFSSSSWRKWYILAINYWLIQKLVDPKRLHITQFTLRYSKNHGSLLSQTCRPTDLEFFSIKMEKFQCCCHSFENTISDR